MPMTPGEAINAAAISAILRLFTPRGYRKPDQEYKSWVEDFKVKDDVYEVKLVVPKEQYRVWGAANADIALECLQDIDEFEQKALTILANQE